VSGRWSDKEARNNPLKLGKGLNIKNRGAESAEAWLDMHLASGSLFVAARHRSTRSGRHAVVGAVYTPISHPPSGRRRTAVRGVGSHRHLRNVLRAQKSSHQHLERLDASRKHETPFVHRTVRRRNRHRRRKLANSTSRA